MKSRYGVYVPVSELVLHGVENVDDLPSEVLDRYEDGGRCLCCGCVIFSLSAPPPANYFHGHVDPFDDDDDSFFGHDCRSNAWPYWRSRRAQSNCKKAGAKARLVLRAVKALREDLLGKIIEAKYAPGGAGAREAQEHFEAVCKRQRV